MRMVLSLKCRTSFIRLQSYELVANQTVIKIASHDIQITLTNRSNKQDSNWKHLLSTLIRRATWCPLTLFLPLFVMYEKLLIFLSKISRLFHFQM